MTIPESWRQYNEQGRRPSSENTHVAADLLGGSNGRQRLVVELAALLLEEDEGGRKAAGRDGRETRSASGAEGVAEHEHGGHDE